MVCVVFSYGPTSPRLRADLSSLTGRLVLAYGPTCLGPSCPRAELSGTHIASVSGLSILDCPFGLYFQCLWIVQTWLPLRVIFPVSLDCPYLITPSGYISSVSGLSRLDYPFGLCCQCLWIVHTWLSLRVIFPVSLDCPYLIVSSGYICSVSGLSILDYPFGLYCQCLWIVYILDCPFRLYCRMPDNSARGQLGP